MLMPLFNVYPIDPFSNSDPSLICSLILPRNLEILFNYLYPPYSQNEALMLIDPPFLNNIALIVYRASLFSNYEAQLIINLPLNYMESYFM